MTVIPFPRPNASEAGAWTGTEMQHLVQTAEALCQAGIASAWAVAATECDDPQFFVIGTSPDEDCLFAFARIGRTYVLQDGAGRVLNEAASLATIAETAEDRAAAGMRMPLVTRALIALGALRLFVEEKIEPIMAEGTEIVARFAPQLAAIA